MVGVVRSTALGANSSRREVSTSNPVARACRPSTSPMTPSDSFSNVGHRGQAAVGLPGERRPLRGLHHVLADTLGAQPFGQRSGS